MYAPQVFHGTSGDVTVPECFDRAAEHLWREFSPAELVAEHPGGKDVGDVLVTGGHVQADRARVHGEDKAPPGLRSGHDGTQESVEEARVLQDCRESHRGQHEPDVVRRLAIPPREKSSSTGSMPLSLTKPVAIAA